MDTEREAHIKPRRLEPGDTIGIVAPASPFDQQRFKAGVGVLESMGFSVAMEDDIFLKSGYLAGSDSQRADLLLRLFADESINAIVCARGGFGSMRTLELLDYAAIQKHPKIFVGFSDISALLSVLNTRCGLVAFHGPMVTSLSDAGEATRDALFTALTSSRADELAPLNAVAIHPGRAAGPVVGGNLTTLCHLVGTPYAPQYKGQIVLLEDKGEAPYRIDRMLSQMKLAGCFEGLAGIILGSFEGCGEGGEIYRLAEEVFQGDNVPVLGGFEIGHGSTNITIPLGIEATLDADRRLLVFNESATAD